MRLQSLNNTVKSAWAEYGGWVVLLVTVYLLFVFRKLFSTVGDAVGNAAEAATSGISSASQTKAAVNKVKQASASAASSGRKITDEHVSTWTADARNLAAYFGQLVGGGWRWGVDEKSAFDLLKSRYSRLMLQNNLPYYIVSTSPDGKKWNIQNVRTEQPNCNKRAFNYTVLAPFYAEATGGRNLVSDIRKYITTAERVTYLKFIL